MKSTHLLLIALAILPLRAAELKIPPEAEALLPVTAMELSRPGPDEGTVERVESPGAPANPVVRLTSPKRIDKTYQLSVGRKFSGPMEKDQLCMFTVTSRVVESADPGGTGRVTLSVQNTGDFKNNILWRGITIEKGWKTNFFVFQAARKLPEGAGLARVSGGDAKQVIEIADFQLYRFPVGFDIFSAPREDKSYTYAGRELDAPWRKAAEARIEEIRKGVFTVKATDSSGKPLEGAKVHVAMKRHLFGFGSALDPQAISGLDPKITTTDQIRYRDTANELFSRIVCENGLRPRQIDADSDPAKPWLDDQRRRMKAAVTWTHQWAQDRRMSIRGHYLSWGYLEPWAADIVKASGPQGLMAAYDRHFKFILPFTDEYVTEWDALNHPVPFVEKDALYQVVGPDVHTDLYKAIRPLTDKMLFVNEDTFNPERTAAFEKHVRRMIANGVTPDGCGFQSHFSEAGMPSIEHEWETWNRFGSLVKNLTITEYDLATLDGDLHADHLRDMLTLAFSHPQMTGFICWGFWANRHWRPTAAFYKADWTERPAVKVWRDLVLTKWRTELKLTTGADGSIPVRAFYGWYDVTIEHGGKSKTFEINHAKSGGKPVLKLD